VAKPTQRSSDEPYRLSFPGRLVPPEECNDDDDHDQERIIDEEILVGGIGLHGDTPDVKMEPLCDAVLALRVAVL
jgi:hypothetical protein